MISTVTSAVTSAVTTTTTTTASVASMATLGAVAVILLIAFLATKELAGASVGRRFQMLGNRLSVGIAPLLMVFGMIVVMKVIEVLT